MGYGAKILQFFYELNMKVGDQDYETYRNYMVEDQSETEKLWDGIGKIISSDISEDYREVILLDGTDHRDGETLLSDNFIPDRVFYLKAPDGTDAVAPQLTEYQEIKLSFYNDHDDGTIVIPYAKEMIPELSSGLPLLDSDKDGKKAEYKGYRVIIVDEKIGEDSIVRGSFISLEPTEENGIPDDYIHTNMGSHRVIYQKDGEMCIYVEVKSCVIFRYGIWNGEVNEDFVPATYQFVDTL